MTQWVLLFALVGLSAGALAFGAGGPAAGMAQLAFFASSVGLMVSVVLSSLREAETGRTETVRRQSFKSRL